MPVLVCRSPASRLGRDRPRPRRRRLAADGVRPTRGARSPGAVLRPPSGRAPTPSSASSAAGELGDLRRSHPWRYGQRLDGARGRGNPAEGRRRGGDPTEGRRRGGAAGPPRRGGRMGVRGGRMGLRVVPRSVARTSQNELRHRRHHKHHENDQHDEPRHPHQGGQRHRGTGDGDRLGGPRTVAGVAAGPRSPTLR